MPFILSWVRFIKFLVNTFVDVPDVEHRVSLAPTSTVNAVYNLDFNFIAKSEFLETFRIEFDVQRNYLAVAWDFISVCVVNEPWQFITLLDGFDLFRWS